jgi:NADPH2:quinone reductase
MRAVVVTEYGGPENCVLSDVEAPTPAADQVLIDVHSASVNFPDLLMIKGNYHMQPSPGFTPGKEVAGTVSAVGSPLTGLSVGDRIFAYLPHGGFAEKVLAPASGCYPIPDAVSFDTAAAMGITYLTSWFALNECAGFAPGERVFITGATGGVGTASVQLVKALGGVALAGLTTASKIDFLRELKADHVIDMTTPEHFATVRDQIHAVTSGEGVDVVLESVGGRSFDESLRSLTWNGRLIVIGFASGEIPSIKANYLLLKGTMVHGFRLSQYLERFQQKAQAVQSTLFEMAASGQISPRIMSIFPLEEFREALDAIRHRTVMGKVVIRATASSDCG